MKKKLKTIMPLSVIVLFFSFCKKDTAPISTTGGGGPGTPIYHTFAGQIVGNDNSTIISSDNNLIISGMSNNKFCVIKSTRTGNLIWRNDFGAGYSDRAIVETATHELFAFGSTMRNYPNSMTDFVLVKMNSSGDTLWSKTYGGSNDDYGYELIKTSDGNLLACGISYSFSQQAYCDIYMIKLNTNGDTLWTKNFYNPQQEESFHLIETQNGEYLATGTIDVGARELYLLKVSATGSFVWSQTIGPTDWKWGSSTVELPNGDLMTCGKHTSSGYNQILLVKTDHLGNEYWEREFGDPTLSEEGCSIKQNSDGSFTIAGSSYDVVTGRNDVVVLKADQNGNQVWMDRFGGSSDDYGYNLIKDLNGDNIVTGTTYSFGTNPSSGNIFITRIGGNGVFQ